MAPVLSQTNQFWDVTTVLKKIETKKKPNDHLAGFFSKTTAFVTAGSFEKTPSLWVSLRGLVIEITGTDRVARPVTEHLVSRRSANFWRVLLWVSCRKRNCSPTICAPTESWIVEKDEEMSQMCLSKVGGGGSQMVETKSHSTLGRLFPNTPKNSLWK